MTQKSNQTWWILGICLAILALAWALDSRGDRSEQLEFFGVGLPTLCGYRWLSGTDCPGCGLTRSFAAAAHGDWSVAFRTHPVGPLLFAVVALQVPLRLWIVFGRQGRPPQWWESLWPRVMLLLVGLCIVSWVVRMV